jgi:hypothetical protein
VRYRGLKKNDHRLIVTWALANVFMVRRQLLRFHAARCVPNTRNLRPTAQCNHTMTSPSAFLPLNEHLLVPPADQSPRIQTFLSY